MPEVLMVAAGGGGDVIGAVMVAETLGLTQRDVSVATVAWERLMVDPVPGPASVDDFEGLLVRDRTYEILPSTCARPPRGSLLPGLRRGLGYTQFLLDPTSGVVGLVEQLHALQEQLTGPRGVWLIDVGGDVLATGAESGLRSPLCDALTLAATAQLGGETRLLVAGPGLDGELTPREVRDRLRQATATLLATAAPPSEAVRGVLEWHPTEASALLAASAGGIRGRVEIRDAGTPVDLTTRSAEVWSMPTVRALQESVGHSLVGTRSLTEAESIMSDRLGWTELAHERRKAAGLTLRTDRSDQPIAGADLDAVRAFEESAVRRGSRYTTFRRLAEQTCRSGRWAELRAALVEAEPERLAGPLWRLG